MAPMLPLAEIIAFVFGLVALGYLAGWTGLLKPLVGDGLSEFAVTIALPVLLFRTMAFADFSGAAPWALWGAYFAGIAMSWTAGHLLVVQIFGRDERAGVVAGITSSFSNLVLVGVPFVLGVYGQDGFEILALLVSVHLPTMMAVSIVLLAWFGREGGSHSFGGLLRNFVATLLSQPLIIGILAGLAWRLTGLPLAGLPARFVDSIADIAGPLALFAVGLGLRKFGISGNVWPAISVSMLKLMLLPGAVLVAAVLFGLPPLTAKVAVAAASMPAGVNSYLIATRFGTGQALASNTMTLTTPLAALTAFLWLVVAQWTFG